MKCSLTALFGWLRRGVGELIRQAGLQLMDLLMQEEVRGRSFRLPLAGHRTIQTLTLALNDEYLETSSWRALVRQVGYPGGDHCCSLRTILSPRTPDHTWKVPPVVKTIFRPQ
jgi:hypothetical protein